MALLPIILLPDPVLRLKAAQIERVDDELRKLADEMLETMYDAPGVGLAAPQVNISRRLAVVDISDTDEGEPRAPLVLINPEIMKTGAEVSSFEEGCLSIPDVRVEIERPKSVTVNFIDRDGNPQSLVAEGFLATAIQHEIDHLDGKLIIDHMSRLKRDMVIRRFRKLARGEV